MKRTLVRVLGGLVLLAACAFAVFRPYHVPTGSMEDTIKAGEHLLICTVAVRPERNALAVVRYPGRTGHYFIKRIVGLPGDRIRIRSKALHVNGRLVDEPWAKHGTPFVDSYRDNFPSPPNVPLDAGAQKMLKEHLVDGEVVVPPGHYFALGDNRDNSLDSRYLGFVAAQDVVARPVLAYYSAADRRLEFRSLR